jgi:hypothetical protein
LNCRDDFDFAKLVENELLLPIRGTSENADRATLPESGVARCWPRRFIRRHFQPSPIEETWDARPLSPRSLAH